MAIEKREAYFHSTNKKSMIRTLIWVDNDVDPIGVFQIAHGLTEHMERYDRFARFMAENGFIVCGNDHIGHGKSAESIEDLGDFGEPDDDIRMVDDMHVLHNIMEKRYPYIPYFLFGHDMGSFLARIYASDFGDELSALILCGTSNVSSKLSYLQDFLYPLGDFIGKDKYSFRGTEVLGKLTSKFYYKEDDENAWLSLSAENREEADADPYFDYQITNASAMNVMKMLFKCSSDEWFETFPIDIPVMIIGGAKDPICFFGRASVAVADKLESIGVDVEIKTYPGLRHEILNEDDYEAVYNDILTWTYSALEKGGDFE